MPRFLTVNGRGSWRLFWLAIAISEGIGLLSGLSAGNSFLAYQNLIQPSFAPPGWLFGPVWVVLYFIIGLASYRITQMNLTDARVKHALGFFLLQLALNFLWTPLFFRLQMRALALAEILVLLVLIIVTTLKFLQLDRLAGYCMIPYSLWVAFAAVLNGFVWMLNR